MFFLAAVALGVEICVASDLVTPPMTHEAPAAGKRVWQQSPEYHGTDVYHSLYLPENWVPGDKYPVLVEYTGNKFPPGNGSGEVRDANLGYGISGGTQFIWVVMPSIAVDGKKNAVMWWGNREATIQYCKQNIGRICHAFGGDLDNLLVCGFSRGAIATSYIGLADDEMLFIAMHFPINLNWQSIQAMLHSMVSVEIQFDHRRFGVYIHSINGD